mmetsp:Transcript_118829/g.383704  ORF Transcript_118829/g.383704 Transcript_118829/m.383704 type:complete len:315 (+) Transcript_118829:78-1022(+)
MLPEVAPPDGIDLVHAFLDGEEGCVDNLDLDDHRERLQPRALRGGGAKEAKHLHVPIASKGFRAIVVVRVLHPPHLKASVPRLRRCEAMQLFLRSQHGLGPVRRHRATHDVAQREEAATGTLARHGLGALEAGKLGPFLLQVLRYLLKHPRLPLDRGGREARPEVVLHEVHEAWVDQRGVRREEVSSTCGEEVLIRRKLMLSQEVGEAWLVVDGSHVLEPLVGCAERIKAVCLAGVQPGPRLPGQGIPLVERAALLCAKAGAVWVDRIDLWSASRHGAQVLLPPVAGHLQRVQGLVHHGFGGRPASGVSSQRAE